MVLDERKINILLAKRQMTREQLTKSAKISKPTLLKGFKEKIAPTSIGRIAAALGVDVEEIIKE